MNNKRTEKVKFIADVNIEKILVDYLRKQGFDTKWVTEINQDLEDIEIFKIANDENKVLITNDKDFGEIVFRQKLISKGIILIRLKNQDENLKLGYLEKLLCTNEDKLKNHFIVISKDKFRFIKQ